MGQRGSRRRSGAGGRRGSSWLALAVDVALGEGAQVQPERSRVPGRDCDGRRALLIGAAGHATVAKGAFPSGVSHRRAVFVTKDNLDGRGLTDAGWHLGRAGRPLDVFHWWGLPPLVRGSVPYMGKPSVFHRSKRSVWASVHRWCGGGGIGPPEGGWGFFSLSRISRAEFFTSS